VGRKEKLERKTFKLILTSRLLAKKEVGIRERKESELMGKEEGKIGGLENKSGKERSSKRWEKNIIERTSRFRMRSTR